MVLHNPNNWHWVNKDASAWAKTYFDEKLTNLSAEENGAVAKIDKVLDVDGDVDVSQRKGKVITLFDVKIRLEFNGKTKEGNEVGGTITIPEAAHDTEEDEYVFDISVYSESKEKEPVKDLIKKSIVPKLRKALSRFAGDLVEEHGKDIQHGPHRGETNSPPTLSDAREMKAAISPQKQPIPEKPATTTTKGAVVNTVTLSDTAEFQTTAEELYNTFLDPQRVAAFTRAPPRVFEPKEGGKFMLFDGNVEGVFVKLEKPKKIVQKWRLAQWPAGHYSTLTLVFDQGYDSTTLRYTWEGVPVGQEEVTKRNFAEYYIKSIKTTFGFGAVL